VQLGGQVQGGVSGIEVLLAAASVREAGDVDLAEDRAESAGMAGLHGTAWGVVGVDDDEALLGRRAQVQVVLVELADQLAPLRRQPLLQLGVGEAARLLPTHEATHLLEAFTACAEGVVGMAGRHGISSSSAGSYSVDAVGSATVDTRQSRCLR